MCKEKQREEIIACAGKSCCNRAFRSHSSQKVFHLGMKRFFYPSILREQGLHAVFVTTQAMKLLKKMLKIIIKKK